MQPVPVQRSRTRNRGGRAGDACRRSARAAMDAAVSCLGGSQSSAGDGDGWGSARPGNEHARPAGQLQVAKELGAENVLQRPAGSALLDHGAEAGRPAVGGLGQGVLAEPAELVAGGGEVAAGEEQAGQQAVDESCASQQVMRESRHGTGGAQADGESAREADERAMAGAGAGIAAAGRVGRRADRAGAYRRCP